MPQNEYCRKPQRPHPPGFEGDRRQLNVERRALPPGVRVNEDGLILPTKLYNPCLTSNAYRDLTHQIRWNVKTGIDVLEKSELQKVMLKRTWNVKEEEKREEEANRTTPFQKLLQERAKRLERLEQNSNEGNNGDGCSSRSDHGDNEFLKVRANLRPKGIPMS